MYLYDHVGARSARSRFSPHIPSLYLNISRSGGTIYIPEVDKMLYDAEELTLDFRALLSTA